MDTEAIRRSDLAALARDPLVRLVMASDGVTEAELVAVLSRAQRAVVAHSVASRCDAALRSRHLRLVPADMRRSIWM